jgi:hypothetical protein
MGLHFAVPTKVPTVGPNKETDKIKSIDYCASRELADSAVHTIRLGWRTFSVTLAREQVDSSTQRQSFGYIYACKLMVFIFTVPTAFIRSTVARPVRISSQANPNSIYIGDEVRVARQPEEEEK